MKDVPFSAKWMHITRGYEPMVAKKQTLIRNRK